jgi:P-type Ca2+ transporter type 2C
MVHQRRSRIGSTLSSRRRDENDDMASKATRAHKPPKKANVSTPAPRPRTSAQASSRLRKLGPNTLPPPRLLPVRRRILGAVRDPLVLVLLGAVVLTSVTGDVADTIVIALVIVVNTTLAVRQEVSADHAVSALARLVAPVVRVLRDDREVSRPVADLVPGDLIVLAEGDLVPTDCLHVGGASLQVDEACVDRRVHAAEQVDHR